MIVTSMAQGQSVTQHRMQLATLNAGNWYQRKRSTASDIGRVRGQGQSGTGSYGTDR